MDDNNKIWKKDDNYPEFKISDYDKGINLNELINKLGNNNTIKKNSF